MSHKNREQSNTHSPATLRGRGKPRRGTQKSRRDREIEELRQALIRERRHSAALEREVAALKRRLQEVEATDYDHPFRRLKRERALRKVDSTSRAEERRREAASQRAQRYRKGSYLRFLFESIMESLPLQVITQLWTYLKRLRVVQLILTIVMAVGAVVLVTILSATALPFIIVGGVTLALLAWMRSRRMNAILKKALEGKHIRVFVPERGVGLSRKGSNPGFFIRQARAMAAEEGEAVLIISPYPLSRRGLGGRGFFFTARREGDNLFLVRRHYYFILRRRVLDAMDGELTVIY